ncbi:permease, partial [Endozoicomonas atrinae]|uniref:permease n=1 Tax=Endozoicomonas atrinae TaxID=1333660 RepID=UPI001EE70E2D
MTKACSFFRDDLNMTRKDILVGLLVASSVSVLMPSSWWELLFWNVQEHGFLAWLWNAIIGIIIAILTFGCSIGNVSLAAVMWWNGVSPGGVMAFLLSSLLTFPMLRMSNQYYGLSVTIRQATVLFLSILLSCLLMDYILDSASIYLVRSNTITAGSGDGAIITLTLNLVIPIAFSKSLSCRQLCLGIITMHYLEQMSRRPQLPEGFNDVDF